jgi:DNA-binding PadR family transcriptional regulator
MTLKGEILSHLEKNGRSQFKDIRDETNRNKKDDWDVQISNCLKELRNQELVEREYVDRDSFYTITNKGKDELQKQRALGEISNSSFARVDCRIVPSQDKRAWASVYAPSIDFATQKQIMELIKKNPEIKIISHKGPPPAEL